MRSLSALASMRPQTKWLAGLIVLSLGVGSAVAQTTTGPTLSDPHSRRFQSAELIPARSSSYIFNPGQPPRIIWRDVDEVRSLGLDGKLKVRWFDAELHEVRVPARPGRWGAYIETTAPNGTVSRRAITFYCRPPGFLVYWPTNASLVLPYQPGPIPEAIWREHQDEITNLITSMSMGTLNDSEAGAILIAGLSESSPLSRPAREIESAAVRNDDFHLAIKLKVQGLADRVRPLQPPRRRVGGGIPVLREGSEADVGLQSDAKQRIDALCRQWAADSGEAFVALVARHGLIITHEAFGQDGNGQAITRDYRCDVASITKAATSILFARFVDQGLVQFDDSISSVFPDFPHDPHHVPTFRQCLTHTSGLTGHAEWGGCRNPYFENIVLNAIEINEPGKQYAYSGMGFDLAAKAMEIITRKSWRRIYDEHLFRPLGMGDVRISSASMGAQFTAYELGLLAQLLANRGSYGMDEYFSPRTFEMMLPEPLKERYPGVTEVEGIGMHWIKHLKPGAPAGSERPQDLVLSPRTIGHGALTGCMFMIDLDADLVIVQVRRQLGPRYAEWSTRFVQTVAATLQGP